MAAANLLPGALLHTEKGGLVLLTGIKLENMFVPRGYGAYLERCLFYRKLVLYRRDVPHIAGPDFSFYRNMSLCFAHPNIEAGAELEEFFTSQKKEPRPQKDPAVVQAWLDGQIKKINSGQISNEPLLHYLKEHEINSSSVRRWEGVMDIEDISRFNIFAQYIIEALREIKESEVTKTY